MRAESDEVGATHRCFKALGHVRPRVEGRQPPRAVGRPGRDLDLHELAHPGHDLEVRVSLHARPEDGQHLRVLASEMARRNRCRARGANRGDAGAIHHRDRRAGPRIEKRDQGLV